MKVFISSKRLQGIRQKDCNWTMDKEMLCYDYGCCEDLSLNAALAVCDCMNSLVGIKSRQITTTFEVVDQDISEEDYFLLMEEYFINRGYSNETAQELSIQRGRELLQIASQFETQRTIERK